jgi:hypothetical protein
VPLDKISARVEEVRFLNRTTAAVRYTTVLPSYSIPEIADRIGRVVLVNHTRGTSLHRPARGTTGRTP